MLRRVEHHDRKDSWVSSSVSPYAVVRNAIRNTAKQTESARYDHSDETPFDADKLVTRHSKFY